MALLQWGAHPLVFVILVFVAALLGGSPFALYPATIGDYYGARYSTVNYGITYTAKAWAGLISGLVSGYFAAQFGSFKFPLLVIAIGSILAAVISSPKLMRAPQVQPSIPRVLAASAGSLGYTVGRTGPDPKP